MIKKHAPEIFSEEIVKAYFGSGGKKISSVRKKPFSKAALALIGIALLLFFILSVFVIKNMPYRALSNKNAAAPLVTPFDRLIEGGSINPLYVKRLSFEGDARGKSAILKNSIMLVNTGSSNMASLDIELNGPVDFRNAFLFINGKVNSGTRYVDLILMDSENKTHRVSKISFSPRGKINNVPLEKKTEAGINFGSIAKVRLEFGTSTAGNAQGTVFYIKDLYLRKTL